MSQVVTLNNNMIESFKFFTESSNKAIEDLKKMIQNPDPERVKMYGGTSYVDMLQLKLNRMLKVEALKDHLRKSKMSGYYKHEDAEDRCKRKADSVYGKKTSAYKSGAIVRCRKGKIWKKK